MYGGDEEEHNEGANQVGLENFIPHLRVLEQEKKKGESADSEGETGNATSSATTTTAQTR